MNKSEKQLQGDLWESVAQIYLEKAGLRLVEANYRCKGGEIDLIMRDGEYLVFVEVRQRESDRHGGAIASVTPHKVRRLVHAARVYIKLHFPREPRCRFDLVAFDGMDVVWFKNVID
jgi:putative endonuclease